MRPQISAILLAFALLAPLLATVAAARGDEPGQAQDGRTNRDARRGDDDDDRGQGKPEARRGAAVGAFAVHPSSREVRGAYVSFDYAENGVTSYAVGGVPLFEFEVAGGDPEARRRGAVVSGAQIRVEMPGWSMRAHDNPTAATSVRTDGEVSLRFAADVELDEEIDGIVRFSSGGVAGRVRADMIRLVDGELIADGNILVLMDTPRGAFDVHRSKISRAIAERHVGAEVSINHQEGGYTEEAVNYANVSITTVTAERGNLTLLIDGNGFEGRVIVANVDGRVLGAEHASDLTILLDGIPVRPADSIEDVLDPDDDGLHPEYFLVHDGSGTFQVLVSLPHYSVHVLTMGMVEILPPPSVIVGLLAGLALLVPSGWALFRRRR